MVLPILPCLISTARSIVWCSSSWMRAVVFGISGSCCSRSLPYCYSCRCGWHTLFTPLT
jgi:uncharacterized protein (DUF779 family)